MNNFTSILCLVKNNHLQRKFTEWSNNSRDTWKNLKKSPPVNSSQFFFFNGCKNWVHLPIFYTLWFLLQFQCSLITRYLKVFFQNALNRQKLILFSNLVTQIRLRIIDPFPCYQSSQKVMRERLDSYLKSNNILCTNEFALFKNSNTQDAIIEFLDYVYWSLDKKQSTIAVYLDFSKTFNTVNRDILMSKLQPNGIRGVMLN